MQLKGNKSRISSLTGKHEYNPDFDKLLRDADHGKLNTQKITGFERPAYYGTSQCIGRNAKKYECLQCPYFICLDDDPKQKCRYPWNDPDESAKEVLEFLPCQK